MLLCKSHLRVCQSSKDESTRPRRPLPRDFLLREPLSREPGLRNPLSEDSDESAPTEPPPREFNFIWDCRKEMEEILVYPYCSEADKLCR